MYKVIILLWFELIYKKLAIKPNKVVWKKATPNKDSIVLDPEVWEHNVCIAQNMFQANKI